MKIITLISVLGMLALAACAIPQGGMVRKRSGGLFDSISKPAPAQAQQFVNETFEVITDPPGARVMVNNSNFGNSPVQVTIRRMWRGDPGYPMILDTVKVEAFPVESGQCVQTGIFGQNAGKTPPQVRFNMASCVPAAPSGKK